MRIAGPAFIVVVFAAIACLSLQFLQSSTDSLGRGSRDFVTAPPQPTAEPVGFEPAAIDLGTLPWGEQIDVPLHFHNRGTAPITIASIETSCACAILPDAVVPGTPVLPGDSIEIPAVIDTGTNPGPFHRGVTVRLVEGGTHVAAISYVTQGTWSLSTDAIDFGTVPIGGPPREITSLVGFSSTLDELADVPRPTVDWLSIEEVRSSRSHERQFLVRLLPAAFTDSGVFSGHVRFESTNPVKPNSVVYVRVSMIHELLAQPAHVVLIPHHPQEVRVLDRFGSVPTLVPGSVRRAGLDVKISGDGGLTVVAGEELSGTPAFDLPLADAGGRSGRVRVSVTAATKELP